MIGRNMNQFGKWLRSAVMQVKVIAYTKEGYRKELAVLSEQQVHMTYGSVGEMDLTSFTRHTRSGVGVHPKDFPEMVKFDVIIEE